jgi:tRNA(fMet)-specific endonuclease VapC
MYLLDTNHCSKLIAGNSYIVNKLTELDDTPIATCVIVRGELVFMAYKSARQNENLLSIQSFLNDIDILPIDDKAADIYGELKAALIDHFGPKEKEKRRNATIEKLGFKENDLWIAAVAKSHEYIIVSTDKDFVRMKEADDLRIESWVPREEEQS